MTFVIAMNTTSPEWRLDNATGSPELIFPKQRRKDLLENLRKNISPGVLKYVAKIMVPTQTWSGGMSYTTHIRY
jgi:hypothetical protein